MTIFQLFQQVEDVALITELLELQSLPKEAMMFDL